MEHLVQIPLGPEEFVLFQEYKNKRLQKLPSACLIFLQLEFPIGKYLSSSSKETEKKPTTTLSDKQIEELLSTSELDKVWDQFSKELDNAQEKEVQDSTLREIDKTLVASKTKSHENKSSSQIMHKEVILAVPTSEIILRVEEILPLDIFHSP